MKGRQEKDGTHRMHTGGHQGTVGPQRVRVQGQRTLGPTAPPPGGMGRRERADRWNQLIVRSTQERDGHPWTGSEALQSKKGQRTRLRSPLGGVRGLGGVSPAGVQRCLRTPQKTHHRYGRPRPVERGVERPPAPLPPPLGLGEQEGGRVPSGKIYNLAEAP